MPNTLGLFPRFITLDLQIEVRPRFEIRMLSKFLIIQDSVKAIWQGQSDDYQEQTKDRFAVLSYMADFNKATVASRCFVMGVMCCCGEEHWKITNLCILVKVLNDIFSEVHPKYKMY
jgi:hypothetical protein